MKPALIKTIEELKPLDKPAGVIAGWVHKTTRSDVVKNTLTGTWLGHPLHPMLTDVPIGAWSMASVLDLTAGRVGAKPARRLVGLGILAALPAAASGASDWSDTYGAGQRLGIVHAVSNLAATALQTASWVARRRGRRLTGILLSDAALGITAGAGYLGGHLSYVQGIGVNNTAFQQPVTKWTDVMALSTLKEGKPTRVVAGDVPVVLVRRGDSIDALSATCVHASGPLDEGTLVADGCIRCPWHGSTFRLADGKVMRGPAAVDQPSWQTKVESGRVLVRSAAS